MPWGVERVLRFLDERAITVIVQDGKPALAKHPTTPAAVFDRWASEVMPHLRANRAEVLKELRYYENPPDPTESLRIGSKAFSLLSPRERRSRIVAHCIAIAAQLTGGKVVWCSQYTKETGRLTDPARLPDTATRLVVIGPTWKEVYSYDYANRKATVNEVFVTSGEFRSYVLPASTTPVNFKAPQGYQFPPDYIPGPGFKPFKESKAARGKRWAERWKTEPTWNSSNPPD